MCNAKPGFGCRDLKAHILPLLRTSCGTYGKFPIHIPEPQFSPLRNGNNICLNMLLSLQHMSWCFVNLHNFVNIADSHKTVLC